MACRWTQRTIGTWNKGGAECRRSRQGGRRARGAKTLGRCFDPFLARPATGRIDVIVKMLAQMRQDGRRAKVRSRSRCEPFSERGCHGEHEHERDQADVRVEKHY